MKMAHTGARTGAAAALTAVIVAAAASTASAVDDDLTVTKTSDVSSVQAGDTVSFTVEVEADGDADGVEVSDTLPEGLTYVPGSSQVTFNDNRSFSANDPFASPYTYANGTNWDGPWTEVGDDNSPNQAPGARIFYMPFFGGHVLSDPSGSTFPWMQRTVTIPADATAVELDIAFAEGVNLNDDDGLFFGMSLDGGGTSDLGGGYYTGQPGVVQHFVEDLSAMAGHEVTIYIGIEIDHDNDGGTNGYYTLSDVTIDVTRPAQVTGPIAGGAPADLTNGTSYDMTDGDVLTITYDAVVDDVLPGDITTLTNSALVTTDSDSAAGTDDTTLDVTRTPALAADVTLPSPILVGEPMPVTIALSHAASSDGADVCSVLADLEGFGFALDSGDDGNGCLEYGETWIMSATLNGMTDTVGAGTMALAASGMAAGQTMVTLDDTVAYTVVSAAQPEPEEPADETEQEELPETGPADAGLLLGGALTLLAAGGAALIARRRLGGTIA